MHPRNLAPSSSIVVNIGTVPLLCQEEALAVEPELGNL